MKFSYSGVRYLPDASVKLTKNRNMGLRGRSKFDKTGNTYFLTTTVLEHIKVFSFGDKYYDVLIESLKYLTNEHEASLLAFVLMPNHLHLLVNMPEGESISDLM